MTYILYQVSSAKRELNTVYTQQQGARRITLVCLETNTEIREKILAKALRRLTVPDNEIPICLVRRCHPL